MKILFLLRGIVIILILASSAFAQAEKVYTKVAWSRLQSFPENFSFEGELSGYLSVFNIEGAWHVYLYRNREALKEHDEASFVKIDDIQFRNILGIVDFSGNEQLLKALDQRLVRIAGIFRTAEYAISEIPLSADKIFSMSWREKNGRWTSDQKKGLDESPLKAGRLLAFPNAFFFKHED